MVDKNALYITYEVSGIKPCGDTSSSADDIKLDVMEVIPQKTHNLIGYIEIVRIPSSLRKSNADRVAAGYGMENVMSSERDSRADIIAQEMDIADPLYTEPYIQMLAENDMYVIKFMQVTKNRRGQGYGSAILDQLPAVLRRIANDEHPVIAVVPSTTSKQVDIERVRNFFEKNNFKRVHACAQSWYRC